MFAALDLATGKIAYRIRERKRWREILDFCKALRRRRPGSDCIWSWTTTDHTSAKR